MYISKLSIRNFRNFRNVSLRFNKGVNTVIGENGCGKTNLFHAIRILIDESMPRTIKLHETDFNRSIGGWKGNWIIIQIEFEDLDSSEEAQSIAMHKMGVVNDFDHSKGTYSMYFRPRIDIRRKLFELSEDEFKSKELLEEILVDVSLNDYEAVFTGRGNIDFSDDLNYSQYVADFDSLVFPNPDDERADIYGVKMYGISIPNEFACTFAKALRDVESDLRSYRDNPLLNLLRDKEKNISIDKKTHIESQITTLNKNISDLDEVKLVSSGISQSIKETVGETYAPNVRIKSELPDEMEKLLQSLKLWVGDSDEEDYEGRLWELSLGGANLIYLSLKLLEFEKIKKENKIANFILIEEPEAHLHTHIQKTLFQKLKNERTQIFISTHSTNISSVSAIGSMNILGKGNRKTEVYNPAKNLSPKKIVKLERYLDANRTNLLFAKGIIMVEGDAEHILIPTLIKKVFGVSLDELGISLINIGSTGFENLAQLFSEDRIRRNCSILTDNDMSIVPLPDPAERDDTTYEKNCRQSEVAGIARKVKLDSYCLDNIYVAPFYAKYTFEVDFLRSNNSYEVIAALKKEYKKKTEIDKIEKLLKDKSVAVSGKEILRLAEKFKKGWFAIMISDEVTCITVIPEYIINAVVFSCQSFNDATLISIAQYRLKSLSIRCFDGDDKDYKKIFEILNAFASHAEALEYYKETLPNDVLTALITKINAKGIK
ncbi:AAA family ATPase [Flavobacterium sp. SORGH_AS_0622]|uniref:AAA family ATPase n=1 Tax=Flavobacterium sp. SORGH_AS_0622 TaxID=3041772 RepID=UPI0027857427|nr:AAA family ATPase [Flavobacterium sp. SORGH_AS_0622]MDQ1166399.1 putative ATP-dependent endonuclease of OLD family [Flavobacterium sp. SORGH_AS_0622]